MKTGFAVAQAFCSCVEALFGLPCSSQRVANLLFHPVFVGGGHHRSRHLISRFLRVLIGRAAEIAIESEEQRAEGVRRFHDAVRGTELERRDDQPFVQLDDHDDRDLLRTARNVFEDRERVHIRMVVLDDEDVERKRRPRAEQL